jgi:hypothetical protein
MRTRKTICALGIGAVVLGGVSVGDAASFTTIQAPPPNEPNHLQIIQGLYGAGIAQAGLNFTDGLVNVTRVSDDDDKFWAAGIYEIETVGAWARNNQTLGFAPGTSGGDYEVLFTVAGKNNHATGGATLDIDETFRWGRISNFNNPHWDSSNSAENGPRELDRMVTYVVSGEGISGVTYLLFWEDLRGSFADDDFNDLVLRVSYTAPAVIPTPAAFGAGLVMLSGLIMRRRQA